MSENQQLPLTEIVPDPVPEPSGQEPAVTTQPVVPEPVETVPFNPSELIQGFEEMKLTLQEEQIKREKLESQLSHERHLRDRSASQAGYYKKVALDLAREPRSKDPYEPVENADDPDSHIPSRFQKELEALREDAVSRSHQDALASFSNKYPDAADYATEMAPFVTQAREDYAYGLDSGDPKTIRHTTELILRQAYLDAKAQRVAKARTEAVTKRAQQMESLTKSKQAAVISGSGSASPPQQKNKDMKEMSPEELDAALRRWARGE